jgi:Uma2 family endonuclease
MFRAMTLALRQKAMTRAQFLDWAARQEGRYEFDGWQPVAMTGGTVNHSQITQNIHFALRTRLRGTPCRPLGPDAGLATVGEAVRYPDALVTCTPVSGTARTVAGVVVVFEVLSPTSGRTDRVVKLREYRAVATLRRYVLLEHAGIGLQVFARPDAEADWTATALTEGDTLTLPELGIEVPVAEFYQDVAFGEGEGAAEA